jgi:thiamine pyrophosphokinase
MVKMKKILFLNGEEPKAEILNNLSDYAEIICADGALNYLDKLNIKPKRVFGDFDSINNLNRDDIEYIHTENQYLTDFDKILTILSEEDCAEIDVFGASGKEQDHFIGNLTVANKWKKRFKIIFFDNYHRYFFPSQIWTAKNVKNKMISVIPFPSAEGIYSSGLQYHLENDSLNIESRVGTRNKAIEDSVTISYKKGNLIIFIELN